jgi:hypothetical protein
MAESLGIALADDAVAEACRVCHKKVWGTGRGRSSESVGLIGRRAWRCGQSMELDASGTFDGPLEWALVHAG